uniref:DdrB-like domain-containing protein n=1 Tax=viral metagenome TaxID=1070528 RepID=A0A6M3XDU4_9ZZZZ
MVNWWDWGSQPSEPEQETAPLDFGAIFNTISSWFSPPAPDYGYSYSGDYQEPQPSYDYYEPPPSPEPTWQTPEPSYDYYEPAPVYEEPEPPPVPPSPSWDFPSWLDRVLQSEYMQAIEEPAAEAESLGAAAEAALSAMQTAESANIEAARIFPSAGIGREPMPFVGPQGPTWLPPEQSYTPPGLNPWESLLWLEEQRTAQPEIFPGQKFFEEQVASPFNIIPELIPPAARAPAALRGLYGGLVDIGTHTETAARVSRAIGNAQRLVDNMARLVEENAPLETIQMARRYAEQAIEAADSLARQLGIQYEPGTTRFGPGPVPAREGAEEVVGGGATARAFGPDPSDVYDMRYRVVELDDLIPSHTEAFDINPLYPQELQPRIRDRAAAKLQVGRIINEFTPDALLVDQFALDRGPMIIGSDNVVESGNGRVIALNTMRREHPEKFASYEQGLRGMVSQYGIDPAQLEGMTSPVLVRERTTPVDRVSFTRMANDPSVLAMSPLEQAIQDSQSINLRGLWVPDETGNIDAILRSASNRDFVSRFLAGLPSNVQASLVDDAGQLNVMGLERIKAAMFARTYPSDAGLSLTETFFESIEPQIKNIESGLMASLPKMAQMEDLIRAGERAPELSIAEDLAKTVDVFARLKEQGMKVTDYLDQITLWERELNPFQEELLRHIDGMSRSPKQIREFIGEYADRVIASPSLQQDAMFRQARPTKGGILDAIAREKELGGPLFTQAEEATPAVPVSPQLERPRGGEGITPPARVPEGAAAVTPIDIEVKPPQIEAPPSVRPQDAALQRQVADILGVSPDVINIEQVTRQATEDDWVRYMAERLARDGQDSPDELAQLLWDNMSPVGRAEALDNFTGTLRDVVDDVAEAAAGGPPTRPSPQRVLRAQAVAIDRDLLAPVEVRTARARATAAQSAKQELQRFLDDFRKQLAEAAVALARGSPPPAEVRAGLARSNAIESRIPQYIEDQVTLAQQAAHIWEDSMSPVSVEVRAAAQRLGLSPEQQAAAVRAATPPPPPAAAGAAGAALPPGGGGGPPPGGGATPFGNWAQGKGAGAGGPALPQVPPPSAYPPGRGLKFLGFLRRFEDVLTEEFPGSRAQALGQILGSTPILRELVQLGGGIAAIAKRPVEFALVGREMLRHDGTLRALAGISHLYRIGLPTTGRAGEALGNLVSGVPGLRRVFPGSIWGQLDDKMRLASGALRGQTVGDIGQQFLTNPNAIRAKLTPQQIEYIQIANALSDDVLVLAKHYNIPINEVQGYMTRKVLSKVDQNGDIVAIAYIGGEPKPIGGKLGMQFARHYATEADAIADGFKYAPHWDAMLINLIGFYNRIADEEMSRWFLANEPWRNLAQGQPRFGEAMTQAFPGKVFTGPNAADTIRYLDKTLDRSIPAWFRKGTAPMYTYNTMQRFYALAGDASVYTIQLLVAAYYKPKQFGRALLGGVSAMFDPTYHWNLISQHSSLLNRYPNVILSATGNEMTEALTRGGILTKAPFSIIGKPLKPFQRLFEAALDEWGIRVLQALDPIADTPRRRAELGLFVNEMRGLFSSQRLGVGPVARHMEGLVTIAPRYNRAVAATLLNAVSRWGDSLRGHQTRLALGRLMVGMTASGVVMTALLRREEIEKLLAQGKTEEVMEIIGQHILPTSDSFQTWEVEGQMVGPGSKYRSVLSLLGDMWKDPSSFDPRNAVLWGENLMTNPGFRFLRGNMAASPGSALDLLWGRNYIGEPTRDNWESFFKNIIAKNTLPLSIQSVLLEGTAHGEDTWQGKLIRGGAQFIGWRSYPTPPYLQWHSYAENALGKGWDEISSTELLALRQSDPRAQELYQANIDDMQYRGRGEEYFGRIQEERDIRNSDIDKAAMAVLLGQKDLNWFRTRLQVLQETYANAKAAIDRDPHYAETVKMLAERDPKTLEDYDYSRYMDILGDPSLIDPLTGEIDYDRRDEMVAALKTELGDEERWERIELRRQMEREQYHYFAQAYYDMVDSEVLREYWEAGTIVDAFILENRLDLSQKDRDALETAVKYAIRLGNDEAEKALSTWYGTTIDDNERRKNMEAAVAKVVSKGTDYADLIGTYGGLEFMEGLRKGAGGTISYGITDVRGIGDATAEKLEAWGITSLSQLATLSADEIAFITGTTAYRIRKDKWVEQAADLLKKGRQGSNPIITTTKSSPAKAQTGENDPRTVEAERPKESPLLPAQTLPSQQSKVAAKSGLANFPEDDLTRISGIGDATADKLETAGIVSFDQLMRLTNAQYKAITGSSGTAALTAARTMYETKISLLKKLGIEVPPLSEIPANLESAATTSAARSTYSAATGGGYRAYSYATKPPVVAQPRPITSWSGAQSAIAAALPPDEVAVVLNYLTYQGATLTPQIRNALAKLMSKSPIEGATTLGEYIRALRRLRRNVILAQTYSGGTGYRRESRWARSYA